MSSIGSKRGTQEGDQLGNQVRAAHHRLVVVVRAQAQGTVRRPGPGDAHDHADLLPVRVLGGVRRSGGRVVGDRVVGVRRQHQPLDDGRAARHLGAPGDRGELGLEPVGGQLLLLDRRERARCGRVVEPHRRGELRFAAYESRGVDQRVEPARLVPATVGDV